MQAEKKKAIFVIRSLRGGGAEKVAATLLESLQRSEDNIELVLVLFDTESTKILGPNINVEYLNVRESGNIIYTTKKFFKIIYHLSKIIKKESPCTILSFMDYSNVVSIISNGLSGKKNKVIISVHTLPTAQLYEYATDFREKTLRILIRSFYKKAHSIIAVSKHVCNDLFENFKIDKSRAQIIYNPIDLNKISLLSDEDVFETPFNENIPIILSVGRLSKVKGFEYLLRAVSLLEGKSDIRLVILGEGKEEASLKKLSTNLGIDKKVFFLGFKDNPYKYMKHSTIFVSPSLYEGFGIAIAEAMACGIPVISTRYNVYPNEIVEHETNGLLVPVADEDALADAMLRLLSNPKERERYAYEAKERVKEFSLEKIVNQYKKVLLDIKQNKAPRF